MKMEYMGLKSISGSLVILQGIKEASFEEIVEIKTDEGDVRIGKIIELAKDYTVVQVYEGTHGCL